MATLTSPPIEIPPYRRTMVCNTMLKACANAGDQEAAERWFKRMRSLTFISQLSSSFHFQPLKNRKGMSAETRPKSSMEPRSVPYTNIAFRIEL